MLLVTHLLKHAPIQPIDYFDARELWLEYRLGLGWAANAPILTPPTGNHKLMKSAWPSYAVSLAPARESGVNVCPFSTPKCRRGCIAFAGKGDLATIKRARIDKTRFLAEHPRAFVTLVHEEIERAYERHGQLAVRLNNFSDLPWEHLAPAWFENPHVRFYDYTKNWNRAGRDNYHLTYSASERTKPEQIAAACEEGQNVAVVFSTRRAEPLPNTYHGVPVLDGDKTDERFLDPRGYIVGLRAKGRMRRPEYRGFVRNPLEGGELVLATA